MAPDCKELTSPKETPVSWHGKCLQWCFVGAFDYALLFKAPVEDLFKS